MKRILNDFIRENTYQCRMSESLQSYQEKTLEEFATTVVSDYTDECLESYRRIKSWKLQEYLDDSFDYWKVVDFHHVSYYRPGWLTASCGPEQVADSVICGIFLTFTELSHVLLNSSVTIEYCENSICTIPNLLNYIMLFPETLQAHNGGFNVSIGDQVLPFHGPWFTAMNVQVESGNDKFSLNLQSMSRRIKLSIRYSILPNMSPSPRLSTYFSRGSRLEEQCCSISSELTNYKFDIGTWCPIAAFYIITSPDVELRNLALVRGNNQCRIDIAKHLIGSRISDSMNRYRDADINFQAALITSTIDAGIEKNIELDVIRYILAPMISDDPTIALQERKLYLVKLSDKELLNMNADEPLIEIDRDHIIEAHCTLTTSSSKTQIWIGSLTRNLMLHADYVLGWKFA